ncbi:hypothetical protein KBD08_02540 [Candidatus Babeliales bacterium]|nr:hypothetical protein [Candidatus Babeliales bacterium]
MKRVLAIVMTLFCGAITPAAVRPAVVHKICGDGVLQRIFFDDGKVGMVITILKDGTKVVDMGNKRVITGPKQADGSYICFDSETNWVTLHRHDGTKKWRHRFTNNSSHAKDEFIVCVLDEMKKIDADLKAAYGLA